MPLRRWDRITLLTHPVHGPEETKGGIGDYLRSGHPSASTSTLSVSNPTQARHWAVLVRGYVLDVSGMNSCGEYDKRGPIPVYKRTPYTEWAEKRRAQGIQFKKKVVGATFWYDDAIDTLGLLIWHDRFFEQYRLLNSNCQNFAYLLFSNIRATEEEMQDIPFDEEATWRSMPKPATHLLRDIGKVVPALALAIYGESVLLSDTMAGVHAALGLFTAAITFGPMIVAQGRDKMWLRAMKKSVKEEGKQSIVQHSRTAGYNEETVEEYVQLGFDVEDVVLFFQRRGLPTRNGRYFCLGPKSHQKTLRALNGQTKM